MVLLWDESSHISQIIWPVLIWSCWKPVDCNALSMYWWVSATCLDALDNSLYCAVLLYIHKWVPIAFSKSFNVICNPYIAMDVFWRLLHWECFLNVMFNFFIVSENSYFCFLFALVSLFCLSLGSLSLCF